ncbi:hypothetical protein BX661DRAFT_131554, partial [Kickxella alabastrina]|uniref:uncharacterized protein n=1 Tax=Kickxella alabastrina TaxID=61397 RepID=UPI00221F6F4E
LNLSNNVLRTLPDEIGYLRRLQILDVSSNQIESLPPTIAYCRELRAIYASYNRLSTLPSAVRHLHALEKVDLYDNRIKCVPVCLHNLPSLEILDLSLNPIKCLASRMFIQGGIAALNRPKMLKLVLDGCPLRRDLHGNCPDNSNLGSGKPTQSAFPSLVETIVCKMANTNAEYPHELPDHLRACLDSLVACDHCHMLYPADKGVKRWRFAYRNKVSLPVEYNMCRPHWNNETERIASLFGLRKLEDAQPYYKHKCAALEAIMRKLSQNNTKLLGRWQ